MIAAHWPLVLVEQAVADIESEKTEEHHEILSKMGVPQKHWRYFPCVICKILVSHDFSAFFIALTKNQSKVESVQIFRSGNFYHQSLPDDIHWIAFIEDKSILSDKSCFWLTRESLSLSH